MSKIRINDLARELEVKSKSILDVLPEVGVTEKKSHSSSLEDHEADKVRARLRAASAAQTSSRSSRPARVDADEIKTKIDLSNISKPGDVLKAIISKQQAPAAAEAPPSAAPPVEAKPAATPRRQRRPLQLPKTPAPASGAPPKFVVPTATPRPSFTAPAPPLRLNRQLQRPAPPAAPRPSSTAGGASPRQQPGAIGNAAHGPRASGTAADHGGQTGRPERTGTAGSAAAANDRSADRPASCV